MDTGYTTDFDREENSIKHWMMDSNEPGGSASHSLHKAHPQARSELVEYHISRQHAKSCTAVQRHE